MKKTVFLILIFLAAGMVPAYAMAQRENSDYGYEDSDAERKDAERNNRFEGVKDWKYEEGDLSVDPNARE